MVANKLIVKNSLQNLNNLLIDIVIFIVSDNLTKFSFSQKVFNKLVKYQQKYKANSLKFNSMKSVD